MTLHDASTIAAVIIEPVTGSTSALIPPQGYPPTSGSLEGLRATVGITTSHDPILEMPLVVDERRAPARAHRKRDAGVRYV
ncbi:hypothetical protein PMI06_006738 [Burkholderia sp. BT03]|nr:hypothetical protein PMI06_006738 [Burkholderia sp. BT03]